MTATLAQTSQCAPSAAPVTLENDIERSIQAVLWHAQPLRIQAERRREKRHAYPYPIRLSPVAADGLTAEGDGIVVLGKHLSPGGLDFYHCEPVPDRRMIATFDCDGEPGVNLLMELTWCRFGRYGWYENGGRFVQALPAEATDLSTVWTIRQRETDVGRPINSTIPFQSPLALGAG